MIRRIVNSFLNSFSTFLNLFRPISTKILTINLNCFNLRMLLLDFLENMIKMIMCLFHNVLCIVKSFSEIFTWVITWDRNLFRKEICPSSISSNFIFSWIMNGEIRSMILLWGNPKYFWLIITFISNEINVFVSSN